MDKSQLGAAIIAFSLLMIATPFGLAKAVTNPSQFISSLSIVIIMYGLIFLVAGVAVFFIKEEKTEEKEVVVNA